MNAMVPRPTSLTRALAKRVLPAGLRRAVRVYGRPVWPPVGLVRFGALRRLTPVSRTFGERGVAIDRYYIERFLEEQAGREDYVAGDIRGTVLEVGDDFYARRFGRWGDAASAVERVDVLSADEAASGVTIVGDLAAPEDLPEDEYDCIICTQVLLLVYDLHAAVRSLHRMLKPGGVALVSVPGLSPLCRPDVSLRGDHWRFTTLSIRRLFEEAFPPASVRVESHGNVLSCVAFLHRLGAEELRPAELDLHDPDYELVITVRAVKAPR